MDTRYLREAAVRKEPRTIRYNYTEDQLNDLREKFTDKALQHADEQELYKEVRREWKEKLEASRADMKFLGDAIRKRYRDETVEVYCVPNFDDGMMEFFDVRTGDMVDARKLRPDEKQMNIIQAAAI